MRNIKSVLALILMLALMLSLSTLFTSCADKEASEVGGGSANTEENQEDEEDEEDGRKKIIYRLTSEKTNYIHIRIKNCGIVVFELYPDVAPETVAWFQELVKADYYNDSKFHRVVKDSYVEGGIPKNTDQMDTLPSLSKETVASPISLAKGVVAILHNEESGLANGKFFLCTGDGVTRDNPYTAIGKVVDGWDALEKLNSALALGSDIVADVEMLEVRFSYPSPVGTNK